jgi:tRNA-splicing ligase RtcB
MDPTHLIRLDDTAWRLDPRGPMRAPVVIYADEALLSGMDDKVLDQASTVATLPGIVGASYVMPDAHWGYGFPIGGAAAFDPTLGGVVSAGGVGFDISCGVRTMLTGLPASAVEPRKASLAERLFASVPASMGRQGDIAVEPAAMDAMLQDGAPWAVARGWGEVDDLARIEEQGHMAGADPAQVSERARLRMRRELGTLGSGNHYLEVQVVAEIIAPEIAAAYGLRLDEVVVTIHSGSRGLGHQVASEFLLEMAAQGMPEGTHLPDRELACAPIASPLASAISAPCARPSTAPSPIARFSAIARGWCSASCSRRRGSACCSTSRTTPARRKRTRSVARRDAYSYTARMPHARSVPATRPCPSRCVRPASRC